MKRKLFSLMTLLLCAATGAWAADAVTATRTYSNDGKTCTWTNVTAAVKNTTAFGADGLMFKTVENASNGIKMGDSNASLKIYELDDVVYVEVASATSNGTITVKSNGDNSGRKLKTKSASEGNIPMVANGKTVNFTAADLTKIGERYYIELTYAAQEASGKEYKLLSAEPFSVTLNNETFPDYVPSTDPAITVEDANIKATESGVAATTTIDVAGTNLTGSTLTATLAANAPAGMSIVLASSTITEGAITTTATLSYTATENANGTTTLTFSDGSTSKEITVTYTAKVTSTTLKTISTAHTWDFNTGVSGNVDFTGEDINTEYVYADIDGLTFTSDFDAEALSFKGQYPRRTDKTYAQAGELHFKTSVAGSVVVKFSDTGSSKAGNATKRYLQINGENTEYWASRGTDDDPATIEQRLNVVSGEIPVEAGDVYISGSSALIYHYVTFTPTPATVAVTGVTVDKTASVEVGKTVSLTATVAPANATNKNVSWSSDATNVATVDENGVVTGVAAGTANITVTTADGNYTDVCVVTVTEAVPVVGGDLTFAYNANDAVKTSWVKSPITINSNANKVDGSGFISPSELTVLGTNALVSKVVLTYQASNRMPSSITADDKTEISTSGTSQTWENNAGKTFVTFTLNGSPRLTQIVVTYVNAVSAPVGATGWATFSSDKALDFTNAEVEAYMVTGFEGNTLTTSKVTGTVPAETGLLLRGTASTTFYVAQAASSDTNVDGNKLVAAVAGTTVTEGTGSDVNYVLMNNAGKAEFQWIGSTSATLGANKAYLTLANGPKSTSARGLTIDIDDESTGIGATFVNGEKVNTVVYNLAGQHVMQPTKGLYIVNGKKVVIK